MPETAARPKVLLTNCLNSPFPGWEDDQLNALLKSQLRKQGAFGFFPDQMTMGLYVIAENIPAETTVFEFPPEDLFVEELKKGYDYLGIQVIATNIPVVVKMVKLAKEIAPDTKVILGGYGAAALTAELPHDPDNCAEYLRTHADHICGGDGVQFLRRLLGANVDDPITQHYMPFNEQGILGLAPFHNSKVPALLAALGCPNGCEFCTTSAFYEREKHRIAKPEELADYMQSLLRRLGICKPLFFVIYDEDFLRDREYIVRLGELLRERGIYDKVSVWCFCSINSISQYTMEELVLAGIGTVFIGLESKLFDQDHDTVHQVFSKRKGRETTELFADLRKHGILSVISTVFGWDFHTRDNIQTDMEYLVSLRSPYYQIAPLTAYPGTPLFKTMTDEGRIFKDFAWRDICFWNDDVFQRANFERGEIRQFINQAYDKIYETNGPSLLSMIDIMAEGYNTLSKSDDPHLLQRAKRYRLFVTNIRVLLYAMKKLAPSDAVVQRVEDVEERLRQYVGRPSAWQRILSKFIYWKMLPIHKKGEKINWEVEAKLPWKITHYNGQKSQPKVKIQNATRRKIRNVVSSVFSQV